MSSESPLIPRTELLGSPRQFSPRLSPDGSLISYVAPTDGVLNLWIAPVADLSQARQVTFDRGRGVQTHGWLHTGTHLWFLQDKGGNENHHLFVVPTAGGVAEDRTPFDGAQARVINFSRQYPEEALVAVNHRDRRWHDVLRINLANGTWHVVYENSGFSEFVANDALQLCVALRNTADGGRDLLVPAESQDVAWTVLFHINKDDVVTTKPLACGAPGESILYAVDSRDRNTAAAVEINLRSGVVKVLGEHPVTDVLDLLIDPASQKAQAYLTDHLHPQWHLIDQAVAADFLAISAGATGDVKIIDRSADDQRWLVALSSDRCPVRYSLYERGESRLLPLFSARPELEIYTLAAMRTVQIPTRDGHTLVSYLTLPAGVETDSDERPLNPMPMLLLVHGGPWARDRYGYNPEHQFWANRGYAVLSVNFRGSTGFGKAFVNAGDLEWGGRMHEDLLDAVDWAIGCGVAQTDQIGIMGGSYGGYATLVALTLTPEIFACGIDLVGPSNLETLLASFPAYWAPLFETFAQRTGDPRTEAGRQLLHDRSPLHRVDAIKRPLLIAQGANDVRVTRVESDQLVAAMRQRGIPVTYLLYPDEGHGFGRSQNRLSFMAIAEVFLARYLGGRCELRGTALVDSSVRIEAGEELVAVVERLPDK